MSIARGIADTANAIGMRPQDLATIISYETAGTFDPKKAGPTTKWGQHRGLIQFGEPQARKYGVNWRDPVNSQLGADGAVAKYFKDSGWKPGMGILNAYSIVNAGSPGKFNASDTAAGGATGTVRDKVQNQFAPHARIAAQLMASIGGGMDKQQSFDDIFGGSWQPSNRYAPKQDDAKPSNDHGDIFGGTWTPSNRYAHKQADAKLDQGGVVAPSTAGGFNPNPISARNAAESTVVAPKIDTLAAYGSGMLQGVVDTASGVSKTNDLLSSYNPVSMLADYFTGGAASKPRRAVSAGIDKYSRDSAKEFGDKYTGSGAADVGRFTGSMLPMIAMPQVSVSGVLPKMAQGALTGALQNTIIQQGRNPDGSIGDSAATGALFGAGGSMVGSAIGKGVSRITGAATGTGQGASSTAISKLLDASAPNLDDFTAAARLQGAIRQGNNELVPGAGVTVPQAAMLPGISQVRRDVANFSPANQLVDREALQEVARLSAIGGISDVSGMTAQDAAQAAGQQIGKQIRGAHAASKQATSDLYQSPALQQSVVDTSALGGKLGDIYQRNFTVGGEAFGGNATLQKAAQVLSGKASLPYQELQNVRSQVAAISNDFGADANIRRVASDMRAQLDNTIDTLPGASAAKAARTEQGRLYESGIAGDITGRKPSGDYQLNEDAITRKLLSTSPGQTARMQGFNAVADQQSKDAAKQAFMADLLERSGRNLDTPAAKLLPNQLAGYTNKRSGTMAEMLTPAEQATISGVTKDAQRAAAANALGMGIGSNTQQNIHGALNLGLMDSKLLNGIGSVGGKVPIVGDMASAVVSSIKNTQRQKLANELADLLSNPEMTDKAITAYIKSLRAGSTGAKAGGLLAVPASQGLLDK